MTNISSNNIRSTVLDNGITVVTEPVEGIASASIGVWLDKGSRDETIPNNGRLMTLSEQHSRK